MVTRQWLTVPSDLVEHADRVVSHFERYGYTVKPEHRELGFPGTPTVVAKQNRGRVTVIVEVGATIDVDRLLEWVRFGKACSTDTKIAVCLPTDATRSGQEEEAMRMAGVGILLSSTAGLMELVPARDLTIAVSLPDLAPLPLRMRRQLGPIYEKFERGEWQDGFADACQALEVEARRYLNDGIRRGRLTFRTKAGKAKTYAEREINRMTIGTLARLFSEIEIQNHSDVVILNALTRVNPDRVGKTHHAAKAVTQNRLRKNVGRHMWVVVDGLKAAHGLP